MRAAEAGQCLSVCKARAGSLRAVRWSPDEHARRQAMPLTENADGLRHKDISQPED